MVSGRPGWVDDEGMKSTAVRYPTTLTIAVADLARGSARYGRAAYGLSLVLAGVAFAGSVFYKEIRQTFRADVYGVNAGTLWEGVFGVFVLIWMAAMLLAALCLPQKGRARTLGVSSIAINLAAALLVACTLG